MPTVFRDHSVVCKITDEISSNYFRQFWIRSRSLLSLWKLIKIGCEFLVGSLPPPLPRHKFIAPKHVQGGVGVETSREDNENNYSFLGFVIQFHTVFFYAVISPTAEPKCSKNWDNSITGLLIRCGNFLSLFIKIGRENLEARHPIESITLPIMSNLLSTSHIAHYCTHMQTNLIWLFRYFNNCHGNTQRLSNSWWKATENITHRLLVICTSSEFRIQSVQRKVIKRSWWTELIWKHAEQVEGRFQGECDDGRAYRL